MIDPKELRIGNFVKPARANENDFAAIDSVNTNGEMFVRGLFNIGSLTYSDLLIFKEETNPIPITPEWLERLGFEKNYYPEIQLTQYVFYVPNDFGGRIIGTDETGEFTTRLEGCDEGRVGIYLKYVHEVQNLAFCLTGAELIYQNKSDAVYT